MAADGRGTPFPGLDMAEICSSQWAGLLLAACRSDCIGQVDAANRAGMEFRRTAHTNRFCGPSVIHGGN